MIIVKTSQDITDNKTKAKKDYSNFKKELQKMVDERLSNIPKGADRLCYYFEELSFDGNIHNTISTEYLSKTINNTDDLKDMKEDIKTLICNQYKRCLKNGTGFKSWAEWMYYDKHFGAHCTLVKI